MDVVEACADALLTAAAHALLLQAALLGTEPGVGIDQARSLSIFMIDSVIDRTYREGPKPNDHQN
jgi:hypothetical protein